MRLKKLGMLALSATFICFLASCDFKTKNETPTTSDTTTVVVTDPVSDPEPQVDNKYKIFLLAQSSGFNGTYEEWLESIKGDSITLEIADGKLKWKYSTEGNDKFRELLDVSSLKGADGNGIVSVTKKGSVGKIDTYKIIFTNGTETEFTVTNGQDGEGKAIDGISKTNTNGLVDEYTITFSDASSYKFYVTNGAEGAAGAAGKGISSITPGTPNGLEVTYTIAYTDNTSSTFTITNGADGNDGAAGRGIKSITKGEPNGLVDTYTITFTDDTTFEFTVTNGENAQQPNPNVFESYEWIDGDLFKVTVTINGTESETIYSRFQGEWINSFKKIKNYDSNNRLVLEESDEWNSESNSWVGQEKKGYEYNEDNEVEIQYVWDNESNSWINNAKVTSLFDEGGNLTTIVAIPWDKDNNDWSTTLKYVNTFSNNKPTSFVTYKWSSAKNDWSEYGAASYYSIVDDTTMDVTYTWTDETSGWTDATYNVKGTIERNGVKYYYVDLTFIWDKVNSKYVTTRVLEYSDFQSDGKDEGKFMTCNSYTDNFPWNNKYLWSRKVTTAYDVMDSVNKIYHETYFNYYFSLENKTFIPDRFVDKQYTYTYLYDGVNNGNHAIRDERIISETIAEGEYDIATDMFSIGYTTTTTVDSNNRVTHLEEREYKDGNEGVLIRVEDYTYNENGRLTKIEGFESPDNNGQWTDIWVFTYTYDEHNRYDSMLVVQKESMDDEFDNIWRSETVYNEDGSYTTMSYNWDKNANDWVYDNTWSL